MSLRIFTCETCGECHRYEAAQGPTRRFCESCAKGRLRAYNREYQQRDEIRKKRAAGMARKSIEDPDHAYRVRQKFYYGRPAAEVVSLRALGRCQICGTTDPRHSKGFSVDHDHACCPGPRSCGECVRGLLCPRCNTLVGRIEADPEVTAAALRYVAENPRVNWSDHQAEVL